MVLRKRFSTSGRAVANETLLFHSATKKARLFGIHPFRMLLNVMLVACLGSLLLLYVLSKKVLLNTGFFMVHQEDDAYCGGDNVFVDVGALDGDTLDVLWRLRSHNTSSSSSSRHDKYYAWECNPTNVEKLKQRLETPQGSRYDVTVIDKAAWIENTTLQFEAGASNAGKVQLMNNTKRASRTYAVQGMDLAEWILATLKKPDFVFLKVDVEAAEFQVIPRLFETGAIEYIDEFQIEWHDWGAFKTKERRKQRFELEEMLANHTFGNKYATFDMETYGDDNTDWNKVPKYYNASQYPKAWVDVHYFRQAEGCHSPWDVLHN